MNRNQLKEYLDQLYEEALKASFKGEIPVSALLVLPSNQTILVSNQVESSNNPFKHAEILALEKGMEISGSRYLKDSILIVDLEPCLMCLGAIIKAGVSQLYYIQDDPTKGSLSYYHVFTDNSLMINRIDDRRFKTLFDDFFCKLRTKANQ
ncbi:MAG: nucleoside deaminase [Bacilli bacterium]